MFLNHKSAIAASQLVIIILTIVAFMFIAGTISRAYSGLEDKDAEVLCHDSVALRAATALQINPSGKSDDDYFRLVEATIKTAPVLCKTIDKKVGGDKQEVMRAIADKMATCWQMFGEGKYEQTLDSSTVKILPSIFNFGESPYKCFNCYSLIVGDIEEGEITPQEMMGFLSTETHKKSGETYTEYIQSIGGPGRVIYFVTDQNGVVQGIQPNHVYSISFLPKLALVTEGKALAGAVKMGVAGAVVVGIAVLGITPVGWVGIGLTALTAGTAASGWFDLVQAYTADSEWRQVSTIELSTLDHAQRICGSGDIAGK